MSRQSKRARRSRDAPKVQRRSAAVAICPDDSWRVLIADGYRPLSQCPEVMMCVNVYAELIASMTIHLMENGEHGDVRVKDELSRMVDITPNPLMTHREFHGGRRAHADDRGQSGDPARLCGRAADAA